ncbi:MAG: hypothetical protein JKY56_10160 [Kofleriaceae bacterium]|nr:hypothetical protein [Kofleriaceae bacterium]
MHKIITVVVVSFLLSAFAACDDKPKKTVAQKFAQEHQVELTTFRTQLTTITAAAKARAPLQNDGFSEKVQLNTKKHDVISSTEAGNTRIWQLATLLDINAFPDIRLGANMSDLNELNKWIPDQEKTRPPDVRRMESIMKLEYILVLRVLESKAAKQAENDSFTVGYIKADAYLYRLKDAKYLGGVRFGATSSNTIELRGAAATAKGLDRDMSIDIDLSLRAEKSLGKALMAAAPNTITYH